jgi:hypothetical protein
VGRFVFIRGVFFQHTRKGLPEGANRAGDLGDPWLIVRIPEETDRKEWIALQMASETGATNSQPGSNHLQQHTRTPIVLVGLATRDVFGKIGNILHVRIPSTLPTSNFVLAVAHHDSLLDPLHQRAVRYGSQQGRAFKDRPKNVSEQNVEGRVHAVATLLAVVPVTAPDHQISRVGAVRLCGKKRRVVQIIAELAQSATGQRDRHDTELIVRLVALKL